MERVEVRDISSFDGREVELRGWLYNKRSSGRLHFLQVRDGTGLIQCVLFKGDVGVEVFERAGNLPQESAIIVRGVVRQDERSPLGYELGVSSIEAVSAAAEYPISPKEHGVSFLMENRHLWLRSSRPHATLIIRSYVIQACRDFMAREGFILIDAPILTPAACEGTTTLFETDFFGDTAFLTQSGQLYMEAAAMAFGKVYCLGPTFRAEKSKTRRHLSEFWMMEPEIAYCDLEGNMQVAEDLLCFVVQRVLEQGGDELAVLERDLAPLEAVSKPFPRMTYDEAVVTLRSNGSDIEWGADLGGDDESVLSEQFTSPVPRASLPGGGKGFLHEARSGEPQASSLRRHAGSRGVW